MEFQNIIEWLDAIIEAKKTIFNNYKFGDCLVFREEKTTAERPRLVVPEKTFKALLKHIDATIYEKPHMTISNSWIMRSFIYKGVEIVTLTK